MARRRGNWGSYVAALLSITLVLTVAGSLLFILINARSLADKVRENLGFSVILKDASSDVEINRLKKIIDAKPYVYSSEYISKDQAAEDFKRDLGEDFVSVLEYNPLKPSIEIKLSPAYADNDSLAWIEASLQKEEIVYEVSYQKSLIQLVSDNVKKISLFMLSTIAVLLIISFVLIRNTIHQYIFAQRFTIKTMQLVGAKAMFICRPYLSEGVVMGLLAALLANIVLLGAVYLMQGQTGDLFDAMRLETLIFVVVGIVAMGIVICMATSWFSVERYLHRREERLY